MKRLFLALLLVGVTAVILGACAGAGGGGSVVYHRHYGYGGWWGYPPYIHGGTIISPPDYEGDGAVNLPVHPDTGPEFEAMPLPSDPMMDMDMGMPDMMDMDW